MQITILKEDILNSDYFDAMTCPMTKAFRRAGFPDLYEIGGGVRKGHVEINSMAIPVGPYIEKSEIAGFTEMSDAVRGMFKSKGDPRFSLTDNIVAVELQDMTFEVALERFL